MEKNIRRFIEGNFVVKSARNKTKAKILSPVSNDSALTDESLFRHGEGEVQSKDESCAVEEQQSAPKEDSSGK